MTKNMKVVLSRKGFDSTYGKQPSPILPDGTLLSFPIPGKYDKIKYTDIHYGGSSYYDLIKELKPRSKFKPKYNCHLDPDIYKNICLRDKNWKGLFGQKNGAQGHLRKMNVGIGDIFFFFGWFKETEIKDGLLRYKTDGKNLHVIFGYLQIGGIFLKQKDVPDYAKYHPHFNNFNEKNNVIYEASESLSLNKNLPGYGTFKFHKKLVLTKDGESRSRWELPEFFKKCQYKLSFKGILQKWIFRFCENRSGVCD
jgi:hypothetical protein